MLFDCEPGLTLVAESANARKLVENAREHKPDIILLDWDSAQCIAEPLLSSLHQISPHLRIIVLSGRSESETQALQAGADFFVSKTDPPDALLGTIRALVKLDVQQKGEAV
jgi:DNA-binding NarL/FixJ family response regulator